MSNQLWSDEKIELISEYGLSCADMKKMRDEYEARITELEIAFDGVNESYRREANRALKAEVMVKQLERQLAEAPYDADLRSRMNATLADVALDEYIMLGMAGATK